MRNQIFFGILIFVLIILGVQTYRLQGAHSKYTVLSTEFETYKLAQQAYNTEEEKRMSAAIEEIKYEAQQQNEQLKNESEAAYALALDRNNRMYNQQIAHLRAACHSTPASGGENAKDPIGVLADVLTRTDEAAGIYARVADERGSALKACIAAYEAVSDRNP